MRCLSEEGPIQNQLLSVVASAVVELRNDMISLLHEMQHMNKRIDELMIELEEAKDDDPEVDADEVPG